jgi:hypothetical protein
MIKLIESQTDWDLHRMACERHPGGDERAGVYVAGSGLRFMHVNSPSHFPCYVSSRDALNSGMVVIRHDVFYQNTLEEMIEKLKQINVVTA